MPRISLGRDNLLISEAKLLFLRRSASCHAVGFFGDLILDSLQPGGISEYTVPVTDNVM